MMDRCDDEDTRWCISNAMRFWSECPTRRCRRARRCVGDSTVCYAIFWPVVPEEMKAWWLALRQAKGRGRTAAQANRAADAARAASRHREALMQKLQSR